MNQLSKPIAEGRTAEVYAWGQGQILKLYRDWCPPEWVEGEAKVARTVYDAGIPSPEAGDIIEVNGRRGLLYERIEGLSMLQDLNARPWTILKHANELAEIHVKINQLSVEGLYSYKDSLRYALQHIQDLKEEVHTSLLARLNDLPDGNKLCHGDYHPGNVLITPKGPMVIDWMTASVGEPWADVARTSILLTIGPKGAGKQIHPIVRLSIRLFHQVYLDRYKKLIPDKSDQRKKWMPVIAAARLEEQIEPERSALLKMAAEGL